MTEPKTGWYYCGGVNVLVFLLVTVFGVGSWISVNAIFVELPMLVHSLPEGSYLPSYLALIVELANIGPFIFVVANSMYPSRIKLKYVVCMILVFGTVSTLLLAVFWSWTTNVGGVEHSTALFILTFLVSLADCTTAVTFYSFMAVFRSQYLMAFFFGQGLSGLIPGTMGFAQGAGAIHCRNISVRNETSNITSYMVVDVFEDPAFHVDSFFYCTVVLMVLSLIAFSILNLNICDKEKSIIAYENLTESDLNGVSRDMSSFNCDVANGTGTRETQSSMVPGISKRRFVFYLIVVAWIDAATNGLLLGIQSFACLPYGAESYHLSAVLTNVANPTACFLALFLSVKSGALLGALVVTGSGLAAYVFVLAAMSPEPPLVGNIAGSVLVVSIFGLTIFILTT